MRGHFRDQGGLFSYISPETRVPALHPLREIRELVRAVLKDLGPSFGKLYASEGRPSIPPEQLLSALLLQAFYAIRSERQLMEQLDYNLLYRWFVGLAPDDPVWDATTFTKNRERLQRGDVFQKFMTKLLNHPQVKPLLSDEHFSVDGTLIEAWASQKSFCMASWAEPRFVCEVEFRDWTHDGLIRQASFKGEDKLPDDISLEVPRRSKSRTYTGIAGVGLTHPERILWPEPGITKQGLADFYAAIAAWILPHVTGRVLSCSMWNTPTSSAFPLTSRQSQSLLRHSRRVRRFRSKRCVPSATPSKSASPASKAIAWSCPRNG